MKKLLFVYALIFGGRCAFAQGTIVFNNRVPGFIVTHVYAPLSSDPTFHQIGNGSADTPVGAQDWTAFSLIGASGTGGQYGAATTFAQLLGVNGYNQPESSLQPGFPTTTFRTGTNAGYVVGTTATLSGVFLNSPGATMEMVAWDNSSGFYPTWSQAVIAWQAGLIAAGKSALWNQDSFLAAQPAPFMINSEDPSQHVVSFNLYFIPEPSAFALVGLGAVALLIYSKRVVRRTT